MANAPSFTLPSGISTAVLHLPTHPSDPFIPTDPYINIPPSPVFDTVPAVPILHEIFGFSETTTIDVLGVADLHHDTPLG